MTPAPRRPPERPVPPEWPVGGDPAKLTLTANAGTLLSWRGYKVLIDGIHDGGDPQFSAVPPEILRRIEDGAPPFDGVGWLVFTHLHRDHFSARAVQRFLEKHPQTPMFLPAGNEGLGLDPEINTLRAYLMAHASPVRELRLPYGREICYPLAPGLRMTAFSAEHDGEGFEDIEHCCLLFSLDGRGVLFLADSAQDPDYLEEMLRGAAVDTAVMNPLYLNRTPGREAIRRISPAKVVVNHIPFQQEDRLRFREMVVRCVCRWGDGLPPISVLWDELDSIEI